MEHTDSSSNQDVAGEFQVRNLIPLKTWSWCALNLISWFTRPPAGVVWKIGDGASPRCRPRHLTAVQNYEIHPKIVARFFKTGS
ncbi:hypothetical protein AVEN_73898-1 [Araneus ventricosus]|uniref:Uncharacterized protein n=1 Tax=Araneus ventricosus TaxID=182803 RepID=A0A4Y2VBB6_ARAVE|nr:hypothetical protein AVEN_73898-1 [Araneus ventricosus]